MRATLTILRRILIALTFVVVLLQPGYGQRPAETKVADVEVMVVVDRTRSMAAVDWDGEKPRIDGVQSDVKALVDALPGTRFSLITWGTSARLELPFTTDTNALMNAVDTVRLESPYDGTGTKVDTPLEAMGDELERAEKQYPDRRRMLVFLSDGENTADGGQESFADLATYVDGGLVLGYGTESGAPMPVADDLSDKDGYIEVKGGKALSKAQPDNLRTIADETGTRFVSRGRPGGIDELAAGFGGEYTAQPDVDSPAANDLTWVAGLVLFALLLWELRSDWRAIWSAPRALRGERGRNRRTPDAVGARR